MNSPGHRANILNASFTEIGLGYKSLKNDTGKVNYRDYWTQTFGASRNATTLANEADQDALLNSGQAGKTSAVSLNNGEDSLLNTSNTNLLENFGQVQCDAMSLLTQSNAYSLGATCGQSNQANLSKGSSGDILNMSELAGGDTLSHEKHHAHIGAW